MERLLAGLLHAGVLGAWCVWLSTTAPDRATRARRLGAVAAAAALFAAVLVLLPVTAIPPDLLTPVREGGTELQVHIARGEGGDVGSLFAHDYLGLLAAHPHSAESVARLELAATAATSVGLLAAGAEVLGSAALSALFLAAFCTSPVVLNAALGSGAGPMAWLWMLVGGTALAGLRDAPTRRDAGVAIALALGSAVLLCWTRVELAALPLIGVGVGLVHRARWGTRAAAALRARPAVVLAVVMGVGLAAWATYLPVARLVLASGRAGWLIQALHPGDPSAYTLPRILVSLWPPGIALLAMIGMVRAPSVNLGLGLGGLLLLRVYHSAGHGSMTGNAIWAHPLEMMRYVGLLAPVILALSWWGWLALPRWGRVIGALLLLVPATPAAWTLRTRDGDHGPMWTRWGAVDVDSRHEVHLLAKAMRDAPGCGFVAPITPLNGARADWLAWRSAWPDLHGKDLRIVRVPDATLSDARAAIPGAPACVRVYTGLDCNRPDGDGCAAVTAGLERVGGDTFPAMPHAHPSHGFGTREQVELGVWR